MSCRCNGPDRNWHISENREYWPKRSFFRSWTHDPCVAAGGIGRSSPGNPLVLSVLGPPEDTVPAWIWIMILSISNRNTALVVCTDCVRGENDPQLYDCGSCYKFFQSREILIQGVYRNRSGGKMVLIAVIRDSSWNHEFYYRLS